MHKFCNHIRMCLCNSIPLMSLLPGKHGNIYDTLESKTCVNRNRESLNLFCSRCLKKNLLHISVGIKQKLCMYKSGHAHFAYHNLQCHCYCACSDRTPHARRTIQTHSVCRSTCTWNLWLPVLAISQPEKCSGLSVPPDSLVVSNGAT